MTGARETGSPLRVADAVAAVRARNAELGALHHPMLEEALTADAALARASERGPLHRVPYTLKDVWDVAGIPTTYGHAPWADRVPERSGAVHRAFEEAGAVLVGKSHMCDLGVTPESRSYLGGATRNPLDPTRTAGGSSGGAAAAVASSMAAFDWGTDYGGSVRLPAAFCGVVGMRLSTTSWPRPTEGGGSPMARIGWLSAMGPIARDLATCRRVLRAVAPALRARTSAQPEFAGLLRIAPDGFCAGEWPRFDREIRAHLEGRGLPSWPAPLPSARAMDRVFVALLASHAPDLLRGWGASPSAVLGALSVGPLLGDRRLHPASARVALELSLLRLFRHRDPGAAHRAATALRARVDALFDAGFLLVSPTSGYPAPPHGRALSTRGIASFVKLGNLVDATALSVPFGTFRGGLPRGLQLLGPAGSEERLLDLAERILD